MGTAQDRTGLYNQHAMLALELYDCQFYLIESDGPRLTARQHGLALRFDLRLGAAHPTTHTRRCGAR